MIVRQGDVLLVKVDAAPEDAKRLKRERGRVILAHGELTGHHHSIGSRGAALLEAPDGERFLRLDVAAALEHQEHAPIVLDPGIYRVVRQREYAPGEIRRVAD